MGLRSERESTLLRLEVHHFFHPSHAEDPSDWPKQEVSLRKGIELSYRVR